MADTLNIYGITYTGVTGIKTYDSNNNVKTYVRPTGTKSITANGTGIDVAQYADADVAVPNTYSAGDEGKVVDNGALVSQTSATYTTNDTYDTTTISSVTVQVSGGRSNPVAPLSDVNFIDRDGAIRYSYTIAQINNLSELPPNPTHDGLVSQGWNWTLADIKTQMANIPNQPLYVGQEYVTVSGKTEIDLEIPFNISLYLGIAINGSVTIDWGDQSAAATVTGTSSSTQIRTGHTYSKGSYTMTINVTSGNAYFYCPDAYPIINSNSSASTFLQDQRGLLVTDIRMGTGMSASTRAFTRIKKLKAFVFEHSKTSTPTRCFEANGLWHVSLPKTITTINGQSFSNTELSSICLPHGLTTIGAQAFMSCNGLRVMYIPSTVTSITGTAFSDCRTMQEYHFLSQTPPTLTAASFSNISSACIFYVPYSEDHSILEDYQTASNWSTYASRMREEPQ